MKTIFKRYCVVLLFPLLGCQKTEEEPIIEVCDEEPVLLSEGVDGNETTTTYQICSSDIPENWLISITNLVEQINRYSHCSWIETDFEPKGESFEFSIEIEKYSTMELLKTEGIESSFEYSSLVSVPATIQFFQDGETHNADLFFVIEIDAIQEYSICHIYFAFGDIALPYENDENLTFTAWMDVYATPEGVHWRAFSHEDVAGIEIVASGMEYYYSTAVCIEK